MAIFCKLSGLVFMKGLSPILGLVLLYVYTKVVRLAQDLLWIQHQVSEMTDARRLTWLESFWSFRRWRRLHLKTPGASDSSSSHPLHYDSELFSQSAAFSLQTMTEDVSDWSGSHHCTTLLNFLHNLQHFHCRNYTSCQTTYIFKIWPKF